MLNEIDIHTTLDHRYIVKLYRVFKDEQFIYLIMELCENKVKRNLFYARSLPHFSNLDADGFGEGAKSVK